MKRLRVIICFASVCISSAALLSCENKAGNTAGQRPPEPASSPSGVDGEQIIQKSRALDKSRNSTMKTRVKIQEADGATREVHMTFYRKRSPDGGQVMLVEFTAPSEERDRDALITISPQGEIEGTRYAQSTSSFVSAKDVMGEDSLFGMTLQELADGQPEKYDLKLTGEETFGATPVYRLEGRLKQGSESKFPRIVLFISKANFAAVGAEFYDMQEALARRMSVDKMEEIDGNLTRMRWTVDNRARQKKLDFEVLKAAYDQSVSDSLFTREHLKKIASK